MVESCALSRVRVDSITLSAVEFDRALLREGVEPSELSSSSMLELEEEELFSDLLDEETDTSDLLEEESDAKSKAIEDFFFVLGVAVCFFF